MDITKQKEHFTNLLTQLETNRLNAEVDYRLTTRMAMAQKGDRVLENQQRALATKDTLDMQIDICKNIISDLDNGKSVLPEGSKEAPAKESRDN